MTKAMNKLPWLILTVVIGLMAVTLQGCESTPSEVIEPEKMARLLADIHIGESVAELERRSYPDDSTKQALKQAIYARHGVTSEQVDTSMKWYGYHLDKYVEVYDRVIEMLETDISYAQDVAGAQNESMSNMRIELEGDSVDIWPDIRYRRFSPQMPNDNIIFSLNSDRNWEAGDVYILNAKLFNALTPTTMSLTVDYQDGTKDYVTLVSPGSGWQSIKLVLDSVKKAYNVYGAISHTPDPDEVAYIDSISLVRVRRNEYNRTPLVNQRSASHSYGGN